DGRVLDTSWSQQHGSGENIVHESFKGDEIHKWIKFTYRKLYNEYGSSALRGARVALNGLKFTRKHPDDSIKTRNFYYESLCKRLYPIFMGHWVFAPNSVVRKQTYQLFTDYKKELGRMPIKQIISAFFLTLWFLRNYLVDKFNLEKKVIVEKRKTHYT
ncbi:hypothetical protein KAJ27_08560, partial [bacterium]|nr:hypothetical protein [bacterium]